MGDFDDWSNFGRYSYDQAAEASRRNSAELTEAADQVETIEQNLSTGAAELTAVSERLDPAIAEVEDQYEAQSAMVDDYYSSSDSSSDSSDGSSADGNASSGSLLSGFSRLYETMTNYFSRTTSDIEHAETVTDTASDAVEQFKENIETVRGQLQPPVVLGSSTVGLPMTEMSSQLDDILLSFDDVVDDKRNSPAVVKAKRDLAEQSKRIKAFDQDMKNLTEQFERRAALEYLSTVSEAIKSGKHYKAYLDATKLKNFVPTEALGQRVRVTADEILAESRAAIEKEADDNARELVGQRYDRVVTGPDGIDVHDVEQGAHVVHGIRGAVTALLADKTIKKLDELGDKDLVDALVYCGKAFGGPLTNRAIDAVELTVDAADTVIGTGVTVRDAITSLKDWSGDEVPGHPNLSSGDIDRLGEVVIGTQTVKEAFVAKMREKGRESRSELVDYLETKTGSVAEAVQATRLDTLRARRETRDFLIQHEGREIYAEAEAVKAAAIRTLGESLPVRELVDPAPVHTDGS